MLRTCLDDEAGLDNVSADCREIKAQKADNFNCRQSLECDDDKTRFEGKLGKLAKRKPLKN